MKSGKNEEKLTNWTFELVLSFESCPIKSIVRLESNTKEVAVRFNDFRFLKSTMSRNLSIHGFEVGKLNVITCRFKCTPIMGIGIVADGHEGTRKKGRGER